MFDRNVGYQGDNYISRFKVEENYERFHSYSTYNVCTNGLGVRESRGVFIRIEKEI